MTVCLVDFGRDQTGLLGSVGYELFAASGVVTQARTVVGVLDFGNGCYGVDIPPAALPPAASIGWDNGLLGVLFVSAQQDLTILKAVLKKIGVYVWYRRRRRNGP